MSTFPNKGAQIQFEVDLLNIRLQLTRLAVQVRGTSLRSSIEDAGRALNRAVEQLKHETVGDKPADECYCPVGWQARFAAGHYADKPHGYVSGVCCRCKGLNAACCAS